MAGARCALSGGLNTWQPARLPPLQDGKKGCAIEKAFERHDVLTYQRDSRLGPIL